MNPNELIQRYLQGEATDAEVAELDRLLANDSALRRKLIVESGIDAGLCEIARERASQPPAAVRRYSRWLPRRPLAAAAAGLVIGLFSASLVFGFVTQSRAKSVVVLAEGFEDAEMPLDRDLPRRTGAWSGDFTQPHAGDEKVLPLSGSRMVTLPPRKVRKFSYAMRFIDLSTLPTSGPGESRQMEVTASFHGHAANAANLFQIRLAAFGGSLEEARSIWLSPNIDEKALLHVARTVTSPAGEDGWKTLRATIDLPPGATLLLVSLAAATADGDAPKTPHYLDDVRIHLHSMKVGH